MVEKKEREMKRKPSSIWDGQRKKKITKKKKEKKREKQKIHQKNRKNKKKEKY